MKEIALTDFGASANTVVGTGKRGLTDDQLVALPSNNALKLIVSRKKKPVGANSVDKPLAEIVWLDYFRTTESGEMFLIYDSRHVINIFEYFLMKFVFRIVSPALPVIFVFASPSGLELLRICRRWSIDGTFFSCPKRFAQLYTINVFAGETTLPCVYALLPDKSEATYTRMFRALKQYEPSLMPTSAMAGIF